MLKSFLILCFTVLLINGPALPPVESSTLSIIPKPVSFTSGTGTFVLTQKCSVVVEGKSAELLRIGNMLAGILKPATGFNMEVKPASGKRQKGKIYLSLIGSDKKLGDEGYQLTIDSNWVNLTACTTAGIFNGIQTIRQLLPAQIELPVKQNGNWELPAGTIRDYPEYSYRGVMLDVARHFFRVEDVKRYIDLISRYKMNVMHLHLSNDQGWRIEIRKWPKLTSVGGTTQVGGGKGGFYTQEQYAEIVKYAADRYVMIIPELDMPGHTNAALASYPELNCSGKARDLYTGTDVGFSTLCTGNEITYRFIADVLGEISRLTPGPYLHIGGDESHVTKIEDYIPFVNRVQEIVRSLGKQVIGWDEIALSTLKSNSTVQYWAKSENAIKAVKQGARVIMSPAANAYLDMKYDSTTRLGLVWAGTIEIEKGYNWDPATLVPGIKKENIRGVEAALWTETITTMDELEYMVFPRLPGYAEIGWSAPATRNWNEYRIRLGRQSERFKALGIDYYPSKQVPWEIAR